MVKFVVSLCFEIMYSFNILISNRGFIGLNDYGEITLLNEYLISCISWQGQSNLRSQQNIYPH